MSSTVRGAAIALIFLFATSSGAFAQLPTGGHPPPPPPPPPPPEQQQPPPVPPMHHHYRHHHHCLWIHHRCYCPCHHH
jgi:hypothetical protein